MLIYKIGRITYLNQYYLILESNYCGEKLYITNHEDFDTEKISKIYIYEFINEYYKKKFGFSNYKERILFENLIQINSIGPKTALSMISKGFNNILNAIGSGDIELLEKVAGINHRMASKIVFELADRYKSHVDSENLNNISSDINLRDSLKSLGFKSHQIEKALAGEIVAGPLEDKIENAIKIISGG